jgi:CheY-like chemotaxis protein
VKFTERGEVTLRVVPVACADGYLKVRLEVTDTGVGIEPEHQTRIFEEFAQADASTTRRFGGTGLGLSISRQIVELMGSRLTLSSEPGVGSTFAFELTVPLADPDARQPEPLVQLANLRALVVDDNDASRALMVNALAEWGARPIGVASLAAAIKELRTTAYDAVVIDDPLPDGPASKLLKPLLAERAKAPRAIRLASFVSLASAPEAGEPRFDAELTKPLRLAHLHRALVGDDDETEYTGTWTVTLQPPPLPKLRGRVLVVEDQPLNREVAEGMLTALGLRVETAADGRQALEMLAKERFDLVLMDCQMPVMDGFSATAELRRREAAGPRVPIVALTADATSDGREKCLAAGMDDHLAKPFTRAALHGALSKWLSADLDDLVAPPPSPPPAPALLDRATLDALRALPRRGSKDMLSHIVELYLSDSRALVDTIERALDAGQGAELARAAHAWRSYNGNVGAHALARLCRDLEDQGRAGNLTDARRVFGELRALHDRVREELQFEMRRTA